MPGVRSESPLPEVPRIRMALPTASSNVASARAKLAERAKTLANSKAKGRLDDQEKRGKHGRLVPSLGCRTSPPLMPVGSDAKKKRCSWITANSGELITVFWFLLFVSLKISEIKRHFLCGSSSTLQMISTCALQLRLLLCHLLCG